MNTFLNALDVNNKKSYEIFPLKYDIIFPKDPMTIKMGKCKMTFWFLLVLLNSFHNMLTNIHSLVSKHQSRISILAKFGQNWNLAFEVLHLCIGPATGHQQLHI